jgi:hypothetical protein
MLGAEQFKETILDIVEEERWTVPTLRTKMRIIYCEGEAGRLPAGDTRSSSGQSHVDGPDQRAILRDVRREASYARWSIQLAAAPLELTAYASG